MSGILVISSTYADRERDAMTIYREHYYHALGQIGARPSRARALRLDAASAQGRTEARMIAAKVQ